ncbi:hypothetical protein V2J09_013250 [Rumex salicifolius]
MFQSTPSRLGRVGVEVPA